MAYEVPESTIRSAWEAGPRSQGVAYPDYKAQWLAANPGAKISSGGGGGGGGGTGGAPDYGESAVFWNALTELPGANVGTYESDGSIDYYTQESARIQAALDSEAVSPERKRALRDQQAQLDAEYRPQRVEDATSTLQNAGSDADALKALQALEGIGREGGVPSGGSSGGTAARSAGGLPPDVTRGPDGQLIGPNGLPAFDPTDEAQLRREFEANGGERGYGYSFDEYKRYVAEANPNGEVRYTSETAKNLDGRPKTFPGYSRLGQGLESTGQTGMTQAEIQRAANLGYFDNITGRAISDLERKNQSTDVGVQAALDQLDASRQNTRATTEGYTQGLFDEAARTNSVSQASTRRLTGATNQYNASNLAALDAYKSGIAPYQTEIAGTTRQNVAFDPEGLAAQRRALGMGQDIYGGSLDYQSQAARAYADPEDVKRAQEGLRQLHAQTAAGGGGIEQTRNLEHAREQLRTGGDEQRKILDLALDELANGGDRQREVYDRYKGLSTPEMTAAERAILAQSQRQFAIHDKASRDATRADLEERGILSGAGAIAGQQAARQQLGEERVAGTLGAQAQSVGRAMQALEGMGVTANALRAGDQGALGIAHSAADSLRTGEQNALQLEQAAANALREGNIVAAQAYTAAAQRQREQGFAEEYARGQAADTASANNQSARVQGAGIYANQANAIRSANDQINMFNNEQQGITDRFNAGFKQTEYQRLTGLQQDTLNNTVGVNQTNLGNETTLDAATRAAAGEEFGRFNTATQTGIGTAFGNYGLDAGYAGMQIGALESSQGRQERASGTKINTAGQRVGLSQTENKQVQDALDRLSNNRAGVYTANRAI